MYLIEPIQIVVVVQNCTHSHWKIENLIGFAWVDWGKIPFVDVKKMWTPLIFVKMVYLKTNNHNESTCGVWLPTNSAIIYIPWGSMGGIGSVYINWVLGYKIKPYCY